MSGREPEGLLSDEVLRRVFEAAGEPPEGWTPEADPGLADWVGQAEWAHWFYRAPDSDNNAYFSRVEAAIRASAVDSLNALWSAVYYHDRDNPDYEGDLLIAARHSDLRTFEYVLYARRHYATLNWYENQDFEAFVEAVGQNPKLAEWWGDVANQRAMYDLLGLRDWEGDEPWPPMKGDELRKAVRRAAAAGRVRTAAVLRGWAGGDV